MAGMSPPGAGWEGESELNFPLDDISKEPAPAMSGVGAQRLLCEEFCWYDICCTSFLDKLTCLRLDLTLRIAACALPILYLQYSIDVQYPVQEEILTCQRAASSRSSRFPRRLHSEPWQARTAWNSQTARLPYMRPWPMALM